MSDYLREMYADPAFQQLPDKSRFERLKLAQAQGADLGERGATVLDVLRSDLTARGEIGGEETAALNDAIDSQMAVAPRAKVQREQMGFLEAMYDLVSAGPARRAMTDARQVHSTGGPASE